MGFAIERVLFVDKLVEPAGEDNFERKKLGRAARGDVLAVNIQILSDAFFVAGILMTLFAGMMFVSGEGALIGIGFVLRNVVLAFIPMGRARHEVYADYRARKLSKAKKSSTHYVLVTGLIFLFIGIVFTVIWYMAFYNA